MASAKELEEYEEKIEKQEEEILHLEKSIENREEKILKTEGKIFNLGGGLKLLFGRLSKFEAIFFKKGFLRRFSRHKLLYSLTSIISVVLVWRGIWHMADLTPGISNPLISILLGFFILWFIDRFSEVF